MVGLRYVLMMCGTGEVDGDLWWYGVLLLRAGLELCHVARSKLQSSPVRDRVVEVMLPATVRYPSWSLLEGVFLHGTTACLLPLQISLLQGR